MKVKLLGRFQLLFSVATLLSALLIPAVAVGQPIPTNQVVSGGGIVYQKSVSVRYPAAQQVGGLNVVIVGWADIASTISSVTDSNGNNYILAAGTESNIDASQAIYVASNIKAGTNTVTITFNAPVGSEDIRLIEYGGPTFLENTTNPLDTSVSNGDTTNPASTGSLTTNYAHDIVVAAGTIDTGFTSMVTSCGTGCSMFTEIHPTSPFFDIVADAEVTALGTFTGQANVSGGGGGAWVMQMIALRVAGQASLPQSTPGFTSVAPTSSPEAGGVPITITGTGFVAGANVIVSDGTHTASAVNCAVTASTTITCSSAPDFPTGTSPTITVTNPDGGTAGGAFAYTVSTPFNTTAGSVGPDGGSVNGGTSVLITGSDFASGATVTVGGTRADKVVVLSSTSITAVVPAGIAADQPVVVRNPSGASATAGTYGYATGAGINFVQANSAQPSGTTNVSAAFPIAQTAADLNVVAIGWGDTTSTISTVTDTAGNTYVAAAAPTLGTGLTQAIYYAKNIKASGANTVTVTFNTAPANPDIRIVEYSGLDTTNPVDGAAGAAGTGTFLDSGAVLPTATGDMVFGAGTVGGFITAPGNACFGASCAFATALYTSNGNNAEHAFPTVSGGWDATATQDASLPWVMQAVAFRQPAGAVADFSISAGALTPSTVAPGGSATSTVTVTPTGGFASAVSLTCTIKAPVPTGETCAVKPSPVTPGAGAVTSTLTLSTSAGTPAGSSTVTVTGTSGSLTHTTSAVTLTVASGGGTFTLTASPTSQTVSAGSSGTSTITIVPAGGFAGTVTLACAVTGGGTPAPVCSLPATATTTATLTVSTTAPHASLMRQGSVFYAMLLPLCGMTLLGASFGSRKRKALGLLLMLLMISGLLFLSACGGGSSSGGGGGGLSGGTPAGAYTVTVTGTSGSLPAQTTTFTLTVQ